MRAAARSLLLICAALAMLSGPIGCGRDIAVAGGATDTETGGAKATGRILLPGGAAAKCAMLELRAVEYLKDPLESSPSTRGTRKAQADAQGRFHFDSIPAGSYRIEMRCGDSLAAVVEATFADTAARLDFPAISLRHPGQVTGRIRYADGARRPSLARIYGLGIAALADSAGAFVLAGVPAGVHGLSFSSRLPFQDSVDLAGIPVAPDSTTDVGEVVLGQRARQVFDLSGGRLHLEGFAAGNPIIYDNDRFDNTADDEFLWVQASLGKADLRGLILPGVPGADAESFRAFYRPSFRELEIARHAGLRNIPEPVAGVSGRLSLPASGRWEDIVPLPSPGSALIAAEAAKATPEKPLLVFAGGPMTTVASAVLSDPAIAERMIVFATFNFNRPGEDTLAVYVASQRCRLVEWGTAFTWDTLAKVTPLLPGNRFAEAVAERYAAANHPFRFFGDMAGAAFLYDGELLTGARPSVVPAAGKQPVGAGAEYGFLDIPSGTTGFAGIQRDFFAAVGTADAYHPWRVGDTIPAEGYALHATDTAFKVDTSGEAGSLAIHALPAGDWAAYRVQADSGDWDLELRCRMPDSGWFQAGRVGDALARQDVPMAPYFNLRRVRVHLTGGVDTLRVETGAGALDLEWLRLQPPSSP